MISEKRGDGIVGMMETRRFYVEPGTLELMHEFWVRDEILRKRLTGELSEGDELVLFDGEGEDRLYKLGRIEPDGIQLQMVTEFDRKLPKKHIYLFWALSSSEVNDKILQKCTENGVSNFIPLISQNGEKTFDIEHATQVATKSAEAGQWSLVPHIREALSVEEASKEYEGKFASSTEDKHIGIIVGSAAEWSEAELEVFRKLHIEASFGASPVDAAVTAIEKLLQ